MNSIRLSLVMALLFSAIFAMPQDSLIMSKVNIGKKMPDFTLKNLINYPKQNAKISEFGGKLLILDFWTRGCTSCVGSWPKLIELQEVFKNEIQILLVNIYDDEKTVREIIKNQQRFLGYQMDLPMALGDKDLKKIFPHDAVPHVVWISPKGIIKYISSGVELNSEIITKILAETELGIPEKTDERSFFDYTRPLFVNGNGGNEETGGRILWSTMIKEYSLNIGSVLSFGTSKDLSYGILCNFPVKDMFRVLYGKDQDEYGLTSRFPASRIEFRGVDSTSLVDRLNDIPTLRNSYTLQITARRAVPVNQIKQKMLAEIESYFGLKTKIEKQIKTCLVISRSNAPITAFKEGEKSIIVTDTRLELNQISIEYVFDYLSEMNSTFHNFPYPIINESRFDGKLGKITIETNISNYQALNKALEPHGFKLSLQNREVEVLVISSL